MSVEDRLCFITLLCLASANDKNGCIENCTEESVIKLTNLYNDPYESDNEYTRALGVFKRLCDNKMITHDNGKVCIIAFHRRQTSVSSSYERVKRWREKHRQNKDKVQNLTDNNDNVINSYHDTVRLDKTRIEKNTAKENIVDKNPPSLFKEIIEYYSSSVFKAKGFKPKINAADGKALKTALAAKTKKDIEERIDFYLQSEKADRVGISLASIFSTHSENMYLQKSQNQKFL